MPIEDELIDAVLSLEDLPIIRASSEVNNGCCCLGAGMVPEDAMEAPSGR